MEYDLFSTDCPENRLVKATAVYLRRHCADLQNRRDLSTLLSILDRVPQSPKYLAGLFPLQPVPGYGGLPAAAGAVPGLPPGQELYRLLRRTGRPGAAVSHGAGLESYVAAVLRRHLDPQKYQVQVQAKGRYLFELPQKQFALRPDLVVEDLERGERTVLDTKWKLLSPRQRSWGVSQGDMYQMCAYQREYRARQAVLLYPACAEMEGQRMPITCSSESGNLVHIQLLDLQRPQGMADAVGRILRPDAPPGAGRKLTAEGSAADRSLRRPVLFLGSAHKPGKPPAGGRRWACRGCGGSRALPQQQVVFKAGAERSRVLQPGQVGAHRACPHSTYCSKFMVSS